MQLHALKKNLKKGMYNANIDSLVNYNVHILAKKRTINRSVSRILPLPEESENKNKTKKGNQK